MKKNTNNTITIDKETMMRDFFNYYNSMFKAIHTDFCDLSKEELLEYFNSDIYITCASVITGIDEQEFLDFAIKTYIKGR